MPRYSKSNINELKEYLYTSCVHDSKLENIKNHWSEDVIKIDLLNPIFDVKTSLTFLNVGIILKVRGDWPGNRDSILSLTVEDDSTCLHDYLSKHNECMKESIYLLFQMFSGDELHIVAKEVIVE